MGCSLATPPPCIPQQEGKSRTVSAAVKTEVSHSATATKNPKVTTKKVSPVRWGCKKLSGRRCLILSAAFYPEHWAFNRPETFRCSFIVSWCCSTGKRFADMQVICWGAASVLGPCSFLCLSEPPWQRHRLVCWLALPLASSTCSGRHRGDGSGSLHSNLLTELGATLRRVRCTAAPLNK